MAFDRNVALKPELRSSYPHFGKGDAEVWEQWLYNNQDQIKEIFYDITRGGVLIDDPDIDQAMKDAWQYSTAVKIDAIAVLETENLVIEVKPRAHMGAIGQALGYTMLLDHEPINDLPNTPCIVTLSTTQEVKQVAEAFGIRLEIVTPTQT